MKKKTFQIDIPEPCNESWDKMTPQEKGRFCSNCEQTVIDFSYQPDRMIAKTLKEGNGQICGRFRTDQLQRDLVLEPAFYQNTRWKAFGLMLSGLLATETLKGQDIVTPSFSTEISTSSISNKKNNSTLESKIVLSGRILAEDNQEVLIAASIILKGSDIGCSTDTNGVFRLEISTEKSHLIKNKLILEVSYLGYTAKEIIIKKEELQNNLVINLSDIHLLGSGIDMPVLECVTERSPLISQDQTTVGRVITGRMVDKTSKEDQTLYQWLRKKIRTKRAEKAKNKALE
jgi:hypothetical protein